MFTAESAEVAEILNDFLRVLCALGGEYSDPVGSAYD